jgi:cell division protein FtsZ
MNPIIKVIGVGGSGSNTISRMAKLGIPGVELIAVNTDAQALFFCKEHSSNIKKILIGQKITKGLGTGMNPELGARSADESRVEIYNSLKGADMTFVVFGAGGGTGSGAGPVIAEISKQLGVLTVAIVTTPFSFEGQERKNVASKAIENLTGKTDSVIIISNDKLLKVIDEKTTVSGAFSICDDILGQAVQAITDLILVPGIINIDFASVLSVMKDSGKALFGTGVCSGENRAVKSAIMAINSPLLEFSIKGAKAVLFSVLGNDMSLTEIQDIAKTITQNVDSKAKIIFGALKPLKNSNLKKGDIKTMVIATKL